jgi:hypothetical protein
VAAPFVLLLGVAVLVARLDLRPDLAHVRVAVLSGAPEGNYHAVVDELAQATSARGGRLDNVPSAGSVENLERLAAAARSCSVQFALVQAGTPVPASARVELLGRLPRAESLFLLGRSADAMGSFASLAHLRIGIGPVGSGTADVARKVLESRDFQGLGLVLSNHAVAEELDLAQKGELDLAALVIDEDADLVERAVRDRGLAIVGFPHADVVARRFSFLRHGRIGAGQYDPVRMLPPTDKEVLRVETLVVGNRCASRSQTLGLLTALAATFPDFVRQNKSTPNKSGLELAPAAKAFLDKEGLELVDEYFPRLGDVMPPSNWVHVVMAVSLLFNAMGLGNRFRLWRIDAARVKAEHELALCFGEAATLGDIARFDPHKAAPPPGTLAEVERVIHELEALAGRSRRQSLSVLVPMGGEMAYRYQEQVIHETLAVLRAFRERCVDAGARPAAAAPSAGG